LRIRRGVQAAVHAIVEAGTGLRVLGKRFRACDDGFELTAGAVNLHARQTFFAGNDSSVRKLGETNWIATAAKAADGRGRLSPCAFVVSIGRVNLHAVPSRIVHSQQAVARDLHIEIRTRDDEAGDVAFL